MATFVNLSEHRGMQQHNPPVAVATVASSSCVSDAVMIGASFFIAFVLLSSLVWFTVAAARNGAGGLSREAVGVFLGLTVLFTVAALTLAATKKEDERDKDWEIATTTLSAIFTGILVIAMCLSWVHYANNKQSVNSTWPATLTVTTLAAIGAVIAFPVTMSQECGPLMM